MRYEPLPKRPENQQDRQKEKVIEDITFFGDAAIPEDSELYKQVFETAKLLARSGYSIVDGGGPGVMKAATDGAIAGGGNTTAVYWEPRLASIFEGKNVSNITTESETYSNYMMRTLGLIERGEVFVVCRGGTGTISEWGMVWALAKLYYGKHKPVILFGDFWPDLISRVQEAMYIDDNELGVLHYASTKEDVLKLVQLFEMEVATRAHRTFEGDETPFILAPRYSEQLDRHQASEISLNQTRIPNLTTKRQLEDFKTLVSPPARILDIGAGPGYDLSFLTKYYSVIGVEIDKETARIARFENPNADIIEMDIMNYELQENTFKGIWARDIMHHLEPQKFNELMPRLTKALVSGGVLYMIVREGEGSKDETRMMAGKEIPVTYHLFTEERINDIAAQNGLNIVSLEHVVRSNNWLAVAFKKP